MLTATAGASARVGPLRGSQKIELLLYSSPCSSEEGTPRVPQEIPEPQLLSNAIYTFLFFSIHKYLLESSREALYGFSPAYPNRQHRSSRAVRPSSE